MSGPRDFTRTQERRALVAKRYLQGALQSEIAQELGVTQSCISKCLDAIRKGWLAEGIDAYATAKKEQLLKVDQVERESWDSWEKSKRDTETTVQEKNNGKTKVSRRLAKQVGDVRFLEMVLKCVSQRCALLGLSAPQRHVIAWDSLTDAQLLALANGEPVSTVLAMPAAPATMAEA